MRRPAEVWEQIKTAYATGSVGLRELARNMGIPPGTMLARAKREGWSKQVTEAKALTVRLPGPGAPPTVITPFQAVGSALRERGERHLERMAGVSERGVDHVEAMKGNEILTSIDRIEKLDKVARRTFGLSEGDGDGRMVMINIGILSE